MANPRERLTDRGGHYYSDDEVARLLGITVGRLRNKLSAGSPLPPRIQPPGCRYRLWPCAEVHEWLAQFMMCTRDVPAAEGVGRRRGRPTKLEVRSRRH